MKGVVFTGNSTLELRDFPDPTPGPQDVIIRIEASGICGSDLHMFTKAPNAAGLVTFDPNQTEPLIAGHEPCGVIVERGREVTDHQATIGQRVICFHYSGCATCRYCLDGRPQLCRQTVGYGGTAHGGHAEYLRVPASTVVPLPDELSFNAGACLACGTTTAFGALVRVGPLDGMTIGVVGAGPVGVSAVMLAQTMGARVIAADTDPARREQVRSMGAETVIDPLSVALAEIARDASDGFGLDAVIETSGSATGRTEAVAATRPEGSVVLVGLGGGKATLDLDREIVMAPRAILGSRTFSRDELIDCAALVARHNLPIDALVSGVFPLDEAQRAYDLFAAGGTRKHVLRP